jgi:carbamoyltransferase
VIGVEHHRAHLASAFFASPFDEAACCAVDGFGDFVSTSQAWGHGTALDIQRRVWFPHSLGALYTAITQYLGFADYGDEYKVMALAASGGPSLIPEMRRLVTLKGDGDFALDLSAFRHWSEGAAMEWSGGYPTLDPLYGPGLEDRFGARRLPGSPLEARHRDVARALQAVFEGTLLHILDALQARTRSPRLCLAGGCALNAVANGAIRRRTPFRELFVPPAAGDDGTAVGAALDVWYRVSGTGARAGPLSDAALGPSHDASAGEAALAGLGPADAYDVEVMPTMRDTAVAAAELIAGGAIVGWYQGRSEWGARALGNRSIVADPRRSEMRDRINRVVKVREDFRPLAPSVLWEAYGDYFEGAPDPFMTQAVTVRPDRRAAIPAVTHIDGTARVHAVTRAANPPYYALIEAVGERTGVPVVLNTSFNEREPIIDTPAQAVDCFVRTGLDALVIDHVVIRRVSASARAGGARAGPERAVTRA